MKKLPLIDSAWLTLEKPEAPMHVGCLQLFRPPADAPDDYLQQMFSWLGSVETAEPPFNQKLAYPLKGLKQAHWTADDDFDIGYHVRHSALPKPGRIRELFVLVSRLHGSLLDRSRPLWECHLIEGLADGRFALYTKIHHSVVDGVAGMRMMQSSLATDAGDAARLPPWGQKRAKRQKPAETAETAGPTSASAMTLNKLGGKAKGGGGLMKAAAETWNMVRDKQGAAPYQAPKSPLNVKISSARRFSAQSYSLQRIRALAKQHDATINDMVMAMCGGALRRYLAGIDALPDQPLIADVPVSVRPADAAEDGGNAISVILTNLATDLDDPVERLKTIRQSMKVGKERLQRMSAKEIGSFTTMIMMPFMAGQLIGTAGKARPMFNVVISNVPGPRESLYLHGAELDGMYPVSLLFNGQALNITVTSYQDSLDFGIIACRRSLPGIQRLLDYLEDALVELEGG